MENFYSITIAGCKRNLPICKVSDNLSIAAFVMFGDVELTEKCARELLKKCPEHDIIITAEAKGIPLCYEMARQGRKDYVVARKGEKLYMTNPVHVELKSITTARLQNLYLSDTEYEQLRGKRILIVDDVISTGESIKAISLLVAKAGGNVVGKACVLAEGDAMKRSDLIYLEELPVFEK